MKYFYEASVVAYLIIDHNRAVYQLAHTRSAIDGAAHPRKATEQLHMIEQSIPKSCSGVGVIVGNNANDRGQIP